MMTQSIAPPHESGTGNGRGPVRYLSVRPHAFLRKEAAGDYWRFALDPYEGCALGCPFCSARLGLPDGATSAGNGRQVRVKVNAVELLSAELREQSLSGRECLLGSLSDPYQPAEEQFRLTRGVLQALLLAPPLELRIHTRSSLIARDTALLQQLSQRGQVRVVFSIPSGQERINRLLEPGAPSALRRFAAMEALSRAGIAVGLNISPVLPGLSDAELGLESLLARAHHAGARFAGFTPLRLSPGQKEALLAPLLQEAPADARRLRRLLQVPRGGTQPRVRAESFLGGCEKFGLAPLTASVAPRRSRPAAALQLALFDLSMPPTH